MAVAEKETKKADKAAKVAKKSPMETAQGSVKELLPKIDYHFDKPLGRAI